MPSKKKAPLHLSLMWKVLFFLMVFQGVILLGYAYLAKQALDERLIAEKINFKEMSSVYFTKSIENHEQKILDEVYKIAAAQDDKKSNLISYIQNNWADLSFNWGATGFGILNLSQSLTFEHGQLNFLDAESYINNSQRSHLPSHYINCQQDCSLNIIVPIKLDNTLHFLLISTSLFNPIVQFQEILNLKTSIVVHQGGDSLETAPNILATNWLTGDYEMLRKDNNNFYYQLLKKTSEQHNLYQLINTGAIANSQDAYFFVSAFLVPFEHSQSSYLLIFNDISTTVALDEKFNNNYLLFCSLTLLVMALLITSVLFPPIARIKSLRDYLPTLGARGEISQLPLAKRKIIFQDEIDILEDTSNELATHLDYLNNCVQERELELKEMALFDHLTGLPNRGNFTAELKMAITELAKDDKFIAVIFIDLDRFKHINDTLGHDVGDEVLITVAKRLQNSIRSTDIVARLGGDEFTILLRQLHSHHNIIKIVNTILKNFEDPANIDGKMLNIQLSMGISTVEDANVPLSNVIKQADIAMYNAKISKSVRYSFFANEMENQITNQFNLLNDFNAALANDDFELFFQPFYNLKDNRLFGFESLIRWRHVTKNLLAPNDFLPILKDTECIIALEQWILEQGIKRCREMNNYSSAPLVFSINLSADMFMSKNLLTTIKNLINKYAADPALIYIEIVEDSLIDDLNAAIVRIKALQQLGIKVSLDDFGVGYSSLNYLRRLPVDNIKIDRSFVQEILTKKESKQLLSSLIELLINIEKTVTAEGIENEEQLNWLKQHGCHIGQGYYFDQPLPYQSAIALIQSYSDNNVVRYVDFNQE